MVKVFIIGGTGQIGGAVLDLIYSTYPNVSLTALVRDEGKKERLLSKYPQVTPIIGDLDSLEILENVSKDVEIVINAGPDATHADATLAIVRGLKVHDRKGFLLHTSGAASTRGPPDGSTGTKIWDDVKDLTELRSKQDRIHQFEDETAFSVSPDINIAVIAPTAVYGSSPSIDHPLPLTLDPTIKIIKAVGQGFTISSGKNIHSYIHAIDQAKLYLHLLDDALRSIESNSDPTPNLWGPDAYYFGADEELSWFDYITALSKVLKKKGVIATEELKSVSLEEVLKATNADTSRADSWVYEMSLMFAADMRARSTRGRQLGWCPKEAKVRDTLEEVVSKYLELRG